MHVAPDNMESSTGRLLPCRTVAEDQVRSRNFQFKEGDVLYTKLRPYLNKVVRAPFDGLCSSDVLPIRPRIDGGYLSRWMLSRQFLNQVTPFQTGVTLPRISRVRLEQTRVPTPPLPEQRRIVEAIETRFERLDAAVRALERARTNLKRYLVSALGSAFPEENRGSNSDFVELVTVCDTATGGTPRRDTPRYYGGSFPWIKSGELHDGLVTHSEETITQEALDNSNAKVFPAGTVCMALYGATVGKLGILGLDAATNQAVCAFFPHRELNSKYLFWFLRSVRGRLLSNRSGGAQPNISQTIVRHLRVPIPSVEQQYALVAEIERRLSVAEEASAAAERAFHRCGRLRESILETAFQGRLAPQDPNGEPASALLERIRALNQATSKPVRPAKRLAPAE